MIEGKQGVCGRVSLVPVAVCGELRSVPLKENLSHEEILVHHLFLYVLQTCIRGQEAEPLGFRGRARPYSSHLVYSELCS